MVTEVTLAVQPDQRFQLIELNRLLREQYGEFLARFPRTLYSSPHTTAGFLEQSFSARLQNSQDLLSRFLEVFRNLYPAGAGYKQDEINEHLKRFDQEDASGSQADSHLAFITSGLRHCVIYRNHPQQPVFFVELDGLNGSTTRQRSTTVLGYETERLVESHEFVLPVSAKSADALNLKDSQYGLLETIQEHLDRLGLAYGRVEIALDADETCSGLTVNEYQTALMKHDLSDILRNPFQFAVEKGRHILRDPLSVPSKTLNYARYDLVHLFNELSSVLRLSESSLERLLVRVTGGAASRFLRLRRSVDLAIHRGDAGVGEVDLGTFQSPILIQWSTAEQRKLKLSYFRFE